jgi:hypothetical protein
MKLADRLSPIELTDIDGVTRPLSDYWKQRPVVLVFIRHFG